jgi:hypothetical protein
MNQRRSVGEETGRETVKIGERFAGPPGCGNGGYTAGTFAARLGSSGHAAVVRLRAPVPLDCALDVVRLPEGEIEIRTGEDVIAWARPARLEVRVPAVPSASEIDLATARFGGHCHHPFPSCFVCGTDREPGDGLRLFTGPVEGRQMVASTWTPDASLAHADERIDPVYVWSSLDCPGGWASLLLGDTGTLVLGEITARIDGKPRLGESCSVIGWPIRREGARKNYVGSAVVSESGRIYGRASSLWFNVPG